MLNAGNVPLVGMQDLLAVLMTGHRYRGVLSSKSPYLLPAFSRTIRQFHPGIPIAFESLEQALAKSTRLMATGADATISMVSAAAGRAGIDPGRQLLRGTRLSVGVMDGHESQGELAGIARDALLHEGRGCLNASIILAPATVRAAAVANAFSQFREDFPPHPDTLDALRDERRFLEATRQAHIFGRGFVLVEAPPEPRRPGVVVLSRYEAIEAVEEWIRRNDNRLQTVIASKRVVLDIGSLDTCEPGSSQDPPLDWRPDRIDAIDFLVGL